MVKKTSKGKEKKLVRKADAERATALTAQVRALCEGSASGAATAAQYPAFARYDKRGVACAVRFYGAAELPPSLLDWALGLTRKHMRPLYEDCPEWGWSDAKKQAELAHPEARYLVLFQEAQQQQQQPPLAGAQQEGQQQQQQGGQQQAAAAVAAPAPPGGQENSAAASNGGGQGEGAAAGAAQQQPGEPLAFLHYRFEAEEGEAVLYCYEIQVDEAAQGKGLGRFLMTLLEFMGRRAGVARLMLTVFHANEAAMALYRRLGYVLDEGSPGAVDPSGDHKYEIMTKRLRPAAAQ